MRRVIPLAVLAALAALPALAQPPGGLRFGGMPAGMYLTQKAVQEDLKLTEEQLKKVNEISAGQQKAMEDLLKLEGADRFKKIMEVAQSTEKAYADLLKPEQAKRLKQITLQTQGLSGLSVNQELAKDLGITAEQQEKFKTIQMEAFKQTAGLREQFKEREELLKKARELTKATNERLLTLLTAEQKAKWKEMTGEPFKGELQFGPPGAGRPPKK